MVIFNKLPTFYATGTATVAANATAVTGTGTDWTALQPGDLFGVHKGIAIPIATVNSATSITLQYPWPGAAQTNAAYCVQLVPRSVGVQEATRQLLLMLANGNLDSFAGIAGETDALPIFTGAGALTKILPAALLAKMGIVPNGQLPTRLQDTPPSLASTDDLNNFTSSGFYQWGSPAPVNAPFTFGFMISVRRSVATAVQIAFNANSASPMVRYLANSAWTGWVGLALLDALGVVADNLLPARLRATVPIVTDNMDLDRDTGPYTANSPALNRPNNTNGYFWHIRNTADYQSQIFITSSATPAMFRRTKRNGTWGDWKNVDGDVSGPGTAVTSRSIAGFAGTSGQSISQLTVLEGLSALGPVFGGVAPVPSAAGVGLTDGDFNTLTVGGLYTTTGSYANGPLGNPANHVGQVEIEARYTTGLTQIYREFGGAARGNTYKRVGYRSVNTDPWSWTAWARIEAEDTAASLALSALTPAADRMPYFNGTSSAALATLTAFGRSLIDDANGAAAWGTLGGTSWGNDANGGTKLPNGTIFQWGFVSSLDLSGGAVVVYPQAFPNAIYGFYPVILTEYVSAAHSPLVYQSWDWSSPRLSSQTIWCRAGGAPLNVANVRWFAIGR